MVGAGPMGLAAILGARLYSSAHVEVLGPTLLRSIENHQINAGLFATHHFELDDFMKAYDVFARAADTGALKVVVTRQP